MSANDDLEKAAAELDPGASAAEKARRLTPELARQAEESERKEAEPLDSGSAAPGRASAGVADHEKEMQRRGFEKAGPPQGD